MTPTRRFIAIAAVASSLLIATPAQSQTVIYQHDFNSSNFAPLDGIGVEGGSGAGTAWVAEEAWFDDGFVSAGVDEFDAANAFLPFVPESGREYMLSATLDASGDTFNFLTLGFMNNPTVDTLSDQAGGPWMLKRAQQTGFADEVYSALTSTANPEPGLTLHGAFAGPTELSMKLNTQLSQWTVEFFVEGLSVRGPENIDVATTPITHVGISRYVSPVMGTADNFLLTESVADQPFRLTVDRTSGVLSIVNETGSAIEDVIGYSIKSASGALDTTNWTTVTGNYDALSNGGDESVGDTEWTILSGTGPFDLSESVFNAGSGQFSPVMPVNLGAAWLKGTEEDLQFQVIIDDGSEDGMLVEAQVVYEPGAGNLDAFEFGDLDFDGNIDEDDFLNVFANAYLTDTSSFSPAQAYQAGDFNSDGLTDAIDFVLFNQAYILANPGAAALPLAALTTRIPEPSTAMLIMLLGGTLLVARQYALRNSSGIHGSVTMFAMLVMFVAATSDVRADLSIVNGDFQTDSLAPGTFDVGDVPGWFDNGAMLRIDGSYDGGGGDELPIAAGDTLLAIETSFDYVYQSLGTVNSGSNSIEIDFDAIERAVFLDPDGNGIVNINRPSSSVQLDLFRGSFAATEGTDIALSNTLVGSVTFDPLSMFSTIDTNGAGDPEGPVGLTATFENTNFVPGTELWLRLSSPDAAVSATGASIQLDNLTVTEVSDTGFAYPLELQVNRSTGEMRLQNNSGVPVAIDMFRVQSPMDSLNPSAWTGIESSQWANLGLTSQELSQAHLVSNSIAAAADLDLGDSFVGGISEDLVFSFHLAGTAPDVFYSAPVNYISTPVLIGDYNVDNVVNLADYTVWRDNLGSDAILPNRDPNNTGDVGADDYLSWKSNFGATIGAGAVASHVIPEPSTCMLALLGLILACNPLARKA